MSLQATYFFLTSVVTITDEYGDINLGLPGEIESYGFNLTTEYGRLLIKNKKYEYDGDNITYTTSGGGQKHVTATCESGDIKIDSVN